GGLTYPVLAMAYHHRGQAEKAKEALEKAARVIDQGSDVLARGPAGTLPMPWWDWLECCLLYREAKTLIDGSPPADDPRRLLASAHAFAALGDQPKAIETYGQAIKLEPKDPALRLRLAEFPIRSGFWDLAAKDAAELMELEAATPEHRSRLV